jgi:cob(I)alamin adenosyltransferase
MITKMRNECEYDVKEVGELLKRKPRIKNGKCGSGDKMSSLFINGLRLPKSHKVFSVYDAQEKVANVISEFCAQYINDLEKEDAYILRWLQSNLNALGSYCYWRGEKVDYAFPPELLNALENRILNVFQPVLSDCQDFLIHDKMQYILLDRCRVEIRHLEVCFAIWYEVLFGKMEPYDDLLLMAQILNRLSTYFFNLIRYQYYKNEDLENHWSGKVTPFIG